MSTSLENPPAEELKESIFPHNWEEPPKTIFSVDACWHTGDGIGRVQSFVTGLLSSAIEYIKSREREQLKRQIWWEVIGRHLDSISAESEYFAQFDRKGQMLKLTPSKPDMILHDSHIVGCPGCKWKYIQKLATYMKYDKTHEDEEYFSDYMLSIMAPTGRQFANGVEILMESHRRTFYVTEDGGITFKPVGTPLFLEDAAKHW